VHQPHVCVALVHQHVEPHASKVFGLASTPTTAGDRLRDRHEQRADVSAHQQHPGLGVSITARFSVFPSPIGALFQQRLATNWSSGSTQSRPAPPDHPPKHSGAITILLGDSSAAIERAPAQAQPRKRNLRRPLRIAISRGPGRPWGRRPPGARAWPAFQGLRIGRPSPPFGEGLPLRPGAGAFRGGGPWNRESRATPSPRRPGAPSVRQRRVIAGQRPGLTMGLPDHGGRAGHPDAQRGSRVAAHVLGAIP